MNKIKIENKVCLYPLPTVLVGAKVNGTPNYLNVSYCGMVNRVPCMMSISLNRSHYTCDGIRENNCFSINLPSTKMLTLTDYCGIVSGKNVDKSKLFNNFYGELKNAPMIEECPVNIECELIQELDLGGSNITFIGRVIDVYTEEKYFSNNTLDIKKIHPILFSVSELNYYCVGEKIGKAWNVGKSLDI
ncbi:flavin reductase family protein [Clostridium hydrogenum]|uniref:flavin reductase family protein n=1 Tax=Clostridium hydrogenum TaxID=2855764 RepID=UPI001F184856|nr:flavin reductase family protein [Clostridium hydrogenum]